MPSVALRIALPVTVSIPLSTHRFLKVSTGGRAQRRGKVSHMDLRAPSNRL
jgi:hypothetical protein